MKTPDKTSAKKDKNEQTEPSDSAVNRRSKVDQLAQKKLRVFQETTSRALKLIARKKIAEAIALLKEVILENEFLDHYEFLGVGVRDNWEGVYPNGVW